MAQIKMLLGVFKGQRTGLKRQETRFQTGCTAPTANKNSCNDHGTGTLPFLQPSKQGDRLMQRFLSTSSDPDKIAHRYPDDHERVTPDLLLALLLLVDIFLADFVEVVKRRT